MNVVGEQIMNVRPTLAADAFLIAYDNLSHSEKHLTVTLGFAVFVGVNVGAGVVILRGGKSIAGQIVAVNERQSPRQDCFVKHEPPV